MKLIKNTIVIIVPLEGRCTVDPPTGSTATIKIVTFFLRKTWYSKYQLSHVVDFSEVNNPLRGSRIPFLPLSSFRDIIHFS